MMKCTVVTLVLLGLSFALPQREGPHRGQGPKAGPALEGGAAFYFIFGRLTQFMAGKPAWDAGIKEACQLAMGTKGGGDCWAYVNCQGDKKEYKNWNVCYLGGVQYFEDSRIGEFTINFTKAGGKNSNLDGLHSPEIALQNVGPWKKVNVETTMFEGMAGHDYEHKLCRYGTEGDSDDSSLKGKKMAWLCGVPKLGKEAEGGTNNAGNDPKYEMAHGRCNIHVTQYQIYKTKDYSIEATIKDAKDNIIGKLEKTQVKDSTVEVTSKLKNVLIIKTPKLGSVKNTDKEPLEFELGKNKWDSNSKVYGCKVGGYDGGNRDMDCYHSC
ncbi:hypothetical protein F5B20DRAFT_593910 [Whalleya microplaca]|nr:hypothetical protein F5B20DRAFT_593910 [Whalleya microplaca]